MFLILSMEIYILCPNRVKSKIADLFPVNLVKTEQLNSMQLSLAKADPSIAWARFGQLSHNQWIP